jgi:hypothetical protein
MATATKRTLTIEARLKNYLSKDLNALQRTMGVFAIGVAKSWNSIYQLVFNLKTAVAGLAATFGAVRIVQFTREAAEQADELGKLAASTGDLIENLSELQAAFNLAGVKDFTSTLRALAKAQSEALQGNDKFIGGFENLNVSLDDLRTLGPSQLFEEIAKGLDQVSTEQERAVALSQILPRQFLELLPVVGRGIAVFRQSVVDAREVGATITQEQAKIAEELNDSFTKVEIAAKAAGRQLVLAFGPEATKLLTDMAKYLAENRDGVVQVAQAVAGGLVAAFNLAIEAIAGLLRAVDQIPGVELFDAEMVAKFRAQVVAQEKVVDQWSNNLKKWREDDKRNGVTTSEQLEQQTTARIRKEIDTLVALRKQLRAIEQNDAGTRLLGVRDEIAASLRQVREQIAAGSQQQAGAVAQEGVPVLGLPSLDALRDYADNAVSTVQSVFRSTAGRPRLPDPEQDPVVATDSGIPKVTEELRAAQIASDDFFGGFKQGIDESIARWTDMAEAGRDAARGLVDGGLNGLTEAFGSIIDGTKSAKDAFKDFAVSMLQDIARLIPRLLIMRTLSSIFGSPATAAPAFADGGIGGGVTSTAPARAFARGGITNGPTWALMGEGSRREAFVPLPDNRSIPVTLSGGGGGGGNVTINITAMDSKDVQRVLIEQQGTIQRIWTNQMQVRTGARNAVKKAAS